MPRLIANEFVYSSGIMDDCYNDYITSPPTHQQQQQRHLEQQQQPLTTAMQTSLQERTARTISRSQSPPLQMKNYTERVSSPPTNDNTKTANLYPEHHIHTISSSGDDEVENEQVTVEEEISALSDCTGEGFEGFDDYCAPISSAGLITAVNQENIHNAINYLKRHSDDYHEDSEGVVEAIEVEDDDEEIIVGDDGNIMYKSREEVTPVKSQKNRYDCNPHTPNKRKKQENEDYFHTKSSTLLKTPPDQIVEINSDSTTISQKQKRHQINTKFQLNLSQQQQNFKVNNNKCSTESTSEFPVSSPSNPQQPRGGGKYPPRPPLLKNTLPADSFERQLAMITACNPQMTLAEKIQTWECDDELSDVEDVNMFDEEFRRMEEQKKNEFKQKEKSKATRTTKKSLDLKQSDYSAFRQMIINNMKTQQNLNFFFFGQGGGLQHGGKGIETSGSESSKSAKHNDHERPTTSAVAQQQLMQQRRSKPQLYLESGETKKRIVKETPKRNQNSTSPPQTSSSDNERDCFQNAKTNTGHEKLQHSRQIHTHDKLLCQSSSEEANSQDIPTHMQLKSNQRLAQNALNNLRKKSPIRPLPRQDGRKTLSKNARCLTDEEIDSVFRLHRLNPEIDKHPKQKGAYGTAIDEEPGCLIQMRLDFANENKTKLSLEKKQELFKTPIIPQKYLPNTSIFQTEIQTEISNSPVKSLESPSEPKKSSPNSVKHDVTTDDKTDCIENNDLEGVYHQQHEFCNYLGLTGMSTATAMANAVAELAQCNLARRSMRVLRQQQQERKDKSAKEERELRALKMKQLNEIRKRERGGAYDGPTILDETLQKCDDGSLSHTSDPTPSSPSIKDIKKQTSTNSTTKSSTKSLNSVRLVKREPEIKILCHIAANDKEEAERLSKECVKEITQPIRETLMRKIKLRKQDQPEDGDEDQENADTDTNKGKENDKIEIKKELQTEIKTDCVQNDETIPSTAKQIAVENRRYLRSPKLSTNKPELKSTKCGTEIPKDITKQFNEKSRKQDKIPIECKIESVGDTLSVTNSVDTTSTTISFKIDDAAIDETTSEADKQLATTPYILQHKIQMALEESRKSKPSIFIVQSLDSKKELETKSLIHTDAFNTVANEAAETIEHLQSILNVNLSKTESKTKSTSSKFNKKNLRKVLKTRKSNKHLKSNLRSNPKRQLRKRKIIVIKTTKPQEKHQAKSHEIPRVLRSSPKLKSSQSKQNLKAELSFNRKSLQSLTPASDKTKSYRTVHTETNDLESYLNIHNSQTKTRLMAKASALLERSRRMSLRGNSTNIKSKLSTKVRRSKLRLRTTRAAVLKADLSLRPPSLQNIAHKDNRKCKSAMSSCSGLLTSQEPRENIVAKTETEVQTNITALNLLDNENVVVSSTTNTYEPFVRHSSPAALRPKRNSASYRMVSSPVIETKEQYTQSNALSSNRIRYLNAPPSATQTMHNPLKSDNGPVLYIFYELDILIVIQERLVSFWKCSKIINMLSTLQPKQHKVNTGSQRSTVLTTNITNQNNSEQCCNNNSHSSSVGGVRQPASSSTFVDMNQCGEWIQLGELRRNNFDFEISVPYANRICLHNSTPIYLEMRARQLPRNHRDCNLLSMYISIFYYHDEDMIAKCNSIQLDTIQSDLQSINFTTLIDSRYFIMTWPQENLMGKPRSGICKYSLTPQLDTLASIREFKSMRHTIRYLECMSDDKLIGFGETQVTIWDHRSGDVLMNYDLEIPMGRNLGSVYFSSQDIEQNNMIILYQHRDFNKDTPAELTTIACTLAHTQSSYRILQQISLPTPSFKTIKSAINTGDHLVLTGQNDDDIWISTTNPSLVTFLPTQENKRFYNRERSQLIELTEKTLNVDTLTNHILQLAAGLANNLNINLNE